MLTLTATQREKIGRSIRISRLSKAVTQVTLAREIGITQVGLSSIECGRTTPSLPVVLRIAEYLDMSLDTLLGRV